MKPLPDKINEPFKKLLGARDELCNSFRGLSFPLVNKMFEDIGEAIVREELGLDNDSLIVISEGVVRTNKLMPNDDYVKVTTIQALDGPVALPPRDVWYEHLIVIQLSESGTYAILYDGPRRYITEAYEHIKVELSVAQLHQVNQRVPNEERLCGGKITARFFSLSFAR